MYDDNHIGQLYTSKVIAGNNGESLVAAGFGRSCSYTTTTTSLNPDSCSLTSAKTANNGSIGQTGIGSAALHHRNHIAHCLPNHLEGLSLSPSSLPNQPRHLQHAALSNGTNGTTGNHCLSELSEKQQQQPQLISPPAYGINNKNNSTATVGDKLRFFMADVSVATNPSPPITQNGDGSSNGVASAKSSEASSPNGFAYAHNVITKNGIAAPPSLRVPPNSQPQPSMAPVTSPDLNLLKRISPEKLKFMLAPSELYAPDRAFLFGALICLRLFDKPGAIFDDVCAECFRRQIAIENGISPRKADMLHNFSSHVVLLLSDWTDILPADFADDSSMGRLRVILERICLPNPNLKRNVLLLVKNLTIKLERSRRLTEQLSRLEAERVRRLVAGATAPAAASAADIYTACPDPSAVARQLTRIELDWLQRIEPSDIVDSFLLSSSSSGKRQGSTSSMSSNSQNSPTNPLKNCSALKAYVDWFNRLSYLVSSEICLARNGRHLKKKNRAKLIDYFIDVARECLNLGNFNSPMAIIGGLNLPQIQRLKRTWNLVDKQKFAVLEALTGPENNFGPYRSTLKAAQWRSSRGQGRIVIPFFSLFVRDLYYFWERCSDSLNGDSSPPASVDSASSHGGQQSSSSSGSSQNNSPALGQDQSSSNGGSTSTKPKPPFIDFDRFLPLVKHLEQLSTWKSVDCPFAANDSVASYLLATPVLTDDSLFLASYACESPESHHEKERCKNLKSQIS